MRRSLSVLLLIILSLGARAQVSFTGEYTNNFDSYVSLATLPTGWATGGTGSFQSVGNGSSTTGGFYSFVPSSNATDRSLGALHSSSATGYYQVTFTNSTGSTITTLNISYDFEQYRSAGNATGWDVLFNGTSNAALSAAGVTSGITTGTPYVLNKSTTITGLSIAAGTTFTMRWTVNDLSGSDNPVSIDNFKMCVPGAAFSVTASNSSPATEPSPVTLTGSSSLGTSPYTYSWSGPSSYSATGSSPIISPTSAATTTGTYTVSVTDAANCTASATTIVTVNPGTGCSGTPTSGTASASPASLCVSGTSMLSVTGATSAAGLTYQWQSSPTGVIGTFTNISAATDVIYTTSTITSTTYYRLITTCTSSTLSDTSTITHVTVNPLPTISAPGGNVCSGGTGLSITATGASTYSWAPSTGLSATTGATVTANPTMNITYTVTGTSAAGCVNTTTVPVTYNIAPGSLSVTPGSLSACIGNAPSLLTATGGIVGPTTVNSGVITIPASIGSNGTISNSLTVAGIPAGAVITGASVNIINFGANYSADYVINIKAPNNNVLNLVNQKGTATSTVTTLFSNANISSAGTTALSGGTNPFTGTWLADAVSGVGGAPNVSNVTDWNSLFSTPNGNWTLSVYNNTTFSNTVMTSAQWSLTLTYAYQAPVTWTPTTDLYNDALATIPYTGTATTTVYKNPATSGTVTYTALATNSTCTVNATATVTVNPSPGTISGTPTVCQGSTTALSIGATGGTWTTTTPSVASVDASGIVTGVAAGTTAVSYTATTGCVSSVIVTVNALPAAISGTATVCESASTSLTDITTGGTWSSSNTSIGTIDATTGVATGILAGTTNISYTLSTGCYITTILTVNTTPSIITGPLAICQGATTTLSSVNPSGTWASALPAFATIDVSGIATGVSAGTSSISYTLATGCFTTAILTVNPLPLAITGTMELCQGSTATLADATTGGTWSTNPITIASIDASGIITGVAAGAASVTYTLGTGCVATATVTVDPLPASITGTLAVCQGATTTVATTSAGGTWSSSDITIAPIDASGIISGSAAGTATITYTLPTGCITTAIATVNPLPAAISGVLTACVGSNTTLSSTTGGGTWTSSDVTIASASSATGIISGVAAGTATITYTLTTGCTTTVIITINPLPAAITGTLTVCQGLTTTLADATTGGTWTSGTLANATIDASGVVTGMSFGTSIITYTLPTGCMATATVTINAVPAPITGTLSVCQGSTTTLSTLAAGGTWSSALPAVASIDASGVVTGVSAATSNITYTLPTGCITTATVTVNPLPAAITGTLTVCQGLTTTLSSTTTGGTWTSSIPANATIDATGVVTGVAAGTSNITYTLSTGCTTSAVATVNALPATITGTAVLCQGSTTTLSNTTTGGTWSSSSTNASINSSGVVTGITAGTATITYTLGSGCIATTSVTVNAAPSAISGPSSVCTGGTITLTNTVAGGTWASSNANASTSTNVITGVTSGTSIISYILSDGCFTTTTISINPTPAAITGAGTVCQGLTITLGDVTTGGTWSSSNGNVTIGSGNGIVTGSLAGTSVISYALPAGCFRTTVVTVNPLPFAITGTASVCIAGTTTLSSSAGGTWTSSNANATIGSSSGIVTGVTAGTSIITYTLSTGCLATRAVTVNALPGSITGASAVCVASTITLTGTGGGTWLSSNANAAIGSSTGVAMGVTGGTSVITYMLATGCYTTKTITVNALPTVISGTAAVCVGATTTLTSTPAGSWSSGNANASIGSSTGIATGVTAGTSVITYTLPTSCYTTRIVTVNPLPGPITGTATVCIGAQTTLSDAGGGTWSSTSANVTVATPTGIVTGVVSGTATITYTLPTSCTTTTIITVNALPAVYAVTGGGSYCAGGIGLPIGLASSTTGVNYQLYQGAAVVGSAIPGTGSALSMGTFTTAGTYTVAATNSTTGCTNGASGSATITINPLLTPSISLSAPANDTVCSGIPATFSIDTVNAGSAPVYQWAVNGVTVGTTPTYSYTPANGDVLTVKLTSNATCATPATASDTTNLTVITSVTPSVTFAATPGLHVCAGTLVTFSASPVNGGPAPAYRWTQNGINVATGPTYTYAPENGDNLYCMLFSNARCRTNDSIISATSTLIVDSPGTLPVASIAAHPGFTIAAGQSDTLIATASAGVSYQWTVNGLPIAGATNNTYVSSSFANNDTVTCVVTKNTVCAETSSAHAVINIAASVSATNAANTFTIIPNPNNGTFSVAGNMTGDGSVQFAITNLLGQCVYTQNTEIKNGRIDVQVQLPQSLADGTYILTIHMGNTVSTHRIVVNKQ